MLYIMVLNFRASGLGILLTLVTFTEASPDPISVRIKFGQSHQRYRLAFRVYKVSHRDVSYAKTIADPDS